MIILIENENCIKCSTYDKNIKVLRDGTLFNLIKGIHKKPTINIILNGE